jgi:undecaprenyl diphosphate synthase
VKDIIEEAKECNVGVLTLFAFSTENWNRPRAEISMLFSFMCEFLNRNKALLMREGVRFKVFGRRDRLGERLYKTVEDFEAITEGNDKIKLNIALDYGGRWDILNAARQLHKDISAGRVTHAEVTEELFSGYLCLAGLPEPDLLIRTSGELRISNFLLWQCAYSEFYFTHLLWPDFDRSAFRAAVDEFRKRKRRFGKAS